MARRCGAKHIFESNYAKDLVAGPILPLLIRKNGMPLWREAHFQLKMHKTPESRGNFGSSDPQKWYAAVARSTLASQNAQNTTRSEQVLKFRCSKMVRRLARSTFVSQNVQNTTCSDHFLKVRCPKMVRRCGAKHICKSKCAKHHMFGPLFEGQMSKNCTPLWRQAHFQVKMRKTPHVRTTF